MLKARHGTVLGITVTRMYPVTCDGDRVRLRELDVSDLESVLAFYRDPPPALLPGREPCGADRTITILAAAMRSAWHQPRYEYALAVADTCDQIVGGAWLVITDQLHAANIGFALFPRCWGEGLGKETLRLLLCLGFKQLDLHKIWCAALPDDPTACKILIEGGMTESGRTLHDLFTGRALRECVVYTIHQDQWLRQANSFPDRGNAGQR